MPHPRRSWPHWPALLLLTAMQSALAAPDTGIDQLSGQLDDTPEKDWTFTLGAGVGHMPEVPGGSITRTRPLWTVQAAHRNGFYADPETGIGKLWRPASNMHLALFVNQSAKRSENDRRDARTTFAGMGDIKSGAELGATFGYNLEPWSFTTTLIGGLQNANRGQQLVLGIDRDLLADSAYALKLGTSVTLADAQYQQRWFGVSDEQASRSGFKSYKPRAGLSSGVIGLTLIVPVSKQVRMLGNLSYVRMLGSSRNSPLVARQGNVAGGALVQYTW